LKTRTKREKSLPGIPICPEKMDKREEPLPGIPICPENMDKREEIWQKK
jgi:hypothetical protein